MQELRAKLKNEREISVALRERSRELTQIGEQVQARRDRGKSPDIFPAYVNAPSTPTDSERQKAA
jgi:hypothetical protein